MMEHETKEKIDSIDRRTQVIEAALLGTLDGKPGILSRVAYLERVHKSWRKMYWTGIGLGGTGVVSLITALIIEIAKR